MFKINEREIEVEHLRDLGASFPSIGKTLGVSSERARTIYIRMLEKRRINKDIKTHWMHLDKLCTRWGVNERDEMRIIKNLKRNGISSIRDHRCGQPDFLMGLYGIGEKYTVLITKAHKNDLFSKPR